MSTLRDAMSHAALGWVKPELDEILRLVRNEVEYFAEEPTDTGRMRACAGYLHQVQGTLRMVELYAPALVAEELEQLAIAIGAGTVPDRDEACATLMRGSVLLPDYLERLQNGHRDIPIVLLPLLNDIRAGRGEAGINERVLFAFAPDSEAASEAEVDHARGSISGRNRELLDTVGSAVKEELLRIKDALDLHLRTDSAPSQLQQQVDELGAVADTLAMMGLGVARGVVQLQRDALQSVVTGEQAIDEDLLLDIAGALLYVDASLDDQVAHLGATGSGEDDPAAAETRRTVEVLAHEAIANFTAAREHFVAFIETGWQHAELQDVPRLLGEVSGALRMLDLSTAADYLQGVKHYVAAELLERERVPSGRQLDTLADAMASLEYYLEALRDRRPGREDILEITRSSLETLRYWPLPAAGVVTGATDDAVEAAPQPLAVDEAAPQPVAREAVAVPPLHIDPVVPAPAPMASPVLPPPLPWQVAFDEAPVSDAATPAPVDEDTGFIEYVGAIEAPADAVADPIDVSAPLLFGASSADPPAAPLWELGVTGHMPLAEVAQTTTFTGFDPVDAETSEAGAWQVDAPLSLDTAGELAADPMTLAFDGTATHHREGSGFDPVLAELAPQAEGAASMAYHLEEGVLDNADGVLALEADEASSVSFPQDIVPFDVSAEGEADLTPALAPDEAHTRFMAELDAAAAAFEPLPDVAPESPMEAAPSAVAPAPDAVPAVAVSDGGFDPDAENIDQDIREVFLEEFEEELGNLGTLLPAWRAQLDSVDRLRPIRRVFHTLKGSGRLVGARTLGDFAWKIEGMLNRVLDGTRPATPAVVAVVDEAVEVLPQLLAALRDGTPVRADLQGLQAVADRVAAGEETFHVPLPMTAPASPDDLQHSDVDGTPASIDSVLLEILEAEVDSHLATLRSWLALPHPQPVTDPLLRAMHTMNGAFAMTDVPEITAATTGAESYIKRALAADQLPTPEALGALQATALAIETTMAALQADAPRIASQAVLAERLQALADTLPEARWPALVDDADALGEPWDEAASVDRPEEEEEAPHADEPLVQAEPTDGLHADADAAPVAETFGAADVYEDVVEDTEDTEDTDAPPQTPSFGDAMALEQALEEGLHVIEPDADTGQTDASAADSALEPGYDDESAASEVLDAAFEAPDVAYAEHPGDAATVAHGTDPEPLFEMEPPLPALSDAEQAAPVVVAEEEIPSDGLDFSVLDRELVDIFVEEGKDLMDHCDGLISELRDAPDDRDVLAGLQRDLHTLKGGARMAGINAIGDLGHDIESLLESVAAGRTQLERSDVHLLERGFDRLHQLLTRTGQHRQVQPADDLLAAFEARTTQQPASAPLEGAGQEIVDLEIASQPLSAPVPMDVAGDEDESQPRPQQEQVRVRADLLDRLVNHAGELAIYRSRLEQQLGAFRGAMGELERTNARLRDQLRRLDLETEAQIVARYQREQDQAHTSFDPLELDRFSTLQQLSRALNESAADLGGLQGVLDDLSRQYDGLLQQQSRVSSELQDGLMRARMVPFDGLVPRLRRVVRQAGVDTGKQVHLTLEGTHGELDRNVLDRMIAPLEHMLRNSVAHGLETPEQRRAAGKPEEGEIALRLHREGSEIVLEVADDGAGLDREAIRRRALERGLLEAGAALEDHELDNLIFASGFSTADQVSQLAGRGVGMDVVRNEVRQLGGSVDIHSVRGQGVRFTLRLPQTLAVTQAVFVQIGETVYAVPVASVSGIGRISRQRFEAGETTYRYGGEAYTLHDLGTLVGQSPARAEGQAQVPLLLVRAGDLRTAVAIDQVLGNREIVVKPVGLQIASVPGIYGATITGDGRVVVILDVAPLVRGFVANPQRPVQITAQPQQRQVPLVMVVDDSLTMRKVTGRILERHNFEVSVARDGVEALERLEERVPDLMLLDIEMPRMDGYELATAMRADPRYRDVPIVMITSRSGEKHRQRAFEIGVQRYLGKPYQELDLMRNVYDLLGIARVRE